MLCDSTPRPLVVALEKDEAGYHVITRHKLQQPVDAINNGTFMSNIDYVVFSTCRQKV